MDQVKFMKLSRATAVLAVVSSCIYILLAFAWAAFMVKQMFFPDVMGILILALPYAAACAIFGLLALRLSIKHIGVNKSKDISTISMLLSKHTKYAVLFTLGGLIFLPLAIITFPVAVTYLVLNLLALNTEKKLPTVPIASPPANG